MWKNRLSCVSSAIIDSLLFVTAKQTAIAACLSLFTRRPEALVAHRPRPQMRRLRSDGDDPRMWVALSPLRDSPDNRIETVPRGKFQVATRDRAADNTERLRRSSQPRLLSLIESKISNRITSNNKMSRLV